MYELACIQNMKHMKLLVPTLFIASLAASCKPEVPEIKPPPLPTTATINVGNNSNNTYDIVINGTRYGSIIRGEREVVEVGPGSHTVEWIYSNNGQTACYATPNLAAGQTYSASCSY
jgi:hypothetical protein